MNILIPGTGGFSVIATISFYSGVIVQRIEIFYRVSWGCNLYKIPRRGRGSVGRSVVIALEKPVLDPDWPSWYAVTHTGDAYGPILSREMLEAIAAPAVYKRSFVHLYYAWCIGAIDIGTYIDGIKGIRHVYVLQLIVSYARNLKMLNCLRAGKVAGSIAVLGGLDMCFANTNLKFLLPNNIL